MRSQLQTGNPDTFMWVVVYTASLQLQTIVKYANSLIEGYAGQFLFSF